MQTLSPRERPVEFRLSQEDFQQLYLNRISGVAEICLLFEHLDGVCFFMKDEDGRFVAIGAGPRQDFNHDAKALIGCTDYDLYPQHIADRIRADDHHVMSLDRPLLNIVEILVNPRLQTPGWYVTNKFPVHDAIGKVIGITGTVQPFANRRKLLLSGTRLDDALDYIEEHFSEAISIATLAQIAAMSERALRRSFQEMLGMPPHDFILRTRLMKACVALTHTQKSATEIAVECGFYDQSAFALQFRQVIGKTPSEYRRRYTALLATRHQLKPGSEGP
jgi:AraC-like DNA-binding protein